MTPPWPKGCFCFPDFAVLSVHLTYRTERDLQTQLGMLVEQVQDLLRESDKPLILAGDFNPGFGTTIADVCGQHSGAATAYCEEVLRFILDHDLVIVNSFVPHTPSRSSFQTDARTDLDWICVSKTFKGTLRTCTYHDINAFTTIDHLAIMTSFELSQPHLFSNPRSRRKGQTHISKSWRPSEEGMIAGMHAFVTEHSPDTTSTRELAEAARKEAESDYNTQRELCIPSDSEILDLLSEGFDDVGDYLSSANQNIFQYRTLRKRLDKLTWIRGPISSARISKHRFRLYQKLTRIIRRHRALQLSEKSILREGGTRSDAL